MPGNTSRGLQGRRFLSRSYNLPGFREYILPIANNQVATGEVEQKRGTEDMRAVMWGQEILLNMTSQQVRN